MQISAARRSLFRHRVSATCIKFISTAKCAKAHRCTWTDMKNGHASTSTEEAILETSVFVFSFRLACLHQDEGMADFGVLHLPAVRSLAPTLAASFSPSLLLFLYLSALNSCLLQFSKIECKYTYLMQRRTNYCWSNLKMKHIQLTRFSEIVARRYNKR